VKFPRNRRAPGGEIRQDGSWNWPPTNEGLTEQMPTKRKCPSCEDCYFRKNMLCALELDGPCPTFRPAERGLAPERQLSFVFRTERTRAAYAFPQAGARC
jgi:hypothetical protein